MKTYTFDTKKELRQFVRGKTIREIVVTGAMSDARQIELRFDDNTAVAISATTFGTLEVKS